MEISLNQFEFAVVIAKCLGSSLFSGKTVCHCVTVGSRTKF